MMTQSRTTALPTLRRVLGAFLAVLLLIGAVLAGTWAVQSTMLCQDVLSRRRAFLAEQHISRTAAFDGEIQRYCFFGRP